MSDKIYVNVTYHPCGHQTRLEFAIEDEVCLGANGRWYPGVVYHHAQHDAVPEVVAYAINEGGITEDSIMGDDDDDPPLATWSVEDDALLFTYGIIP